MFGSSQGFGYGDAVAQDAPKRTRQEEKQTCVPVTVRILQDAIARHADSQEILIHGAEASIVQLVGTVESLVQQTAMLEFQLNDASGRMKVRYYSTGGGSALDAFPGLAVGRYVSVVGNLRTAPAAHVSAMTIQVVENADEVSYHMISVAHAAMRLRNPKTSADPTTPAKQGSGMGLSGPSPVKVDAPVMPAVAPAMAMQTPAKVQGDLRSNVVDVLKKASESAGDEGISLSVLIGRLAGQPSEKVREVLTQLVDEGEAFTTIDDDHFSMI